MICRDARPLLSALMDDALDRRQSAAVHDHLAVCAACRSELAALRGMSEAVRDRATRYKASQSLSLSIARNLHGMAPRATAPAPSRRRYFAMAAAILVAAILAGGLAVIPFDGRGGDGSVREVASAHRQSQATGQWTDVASANPSDVVRWVSGSASGFTPPVANLRSAGFDLVGARRASVDDQPAVALVYRREHWIIDLFVVPAPAAAAEHARLNREDDLAVVDWTESGLRFFAVSDLDGDALMRFHKSVEDAIRSP